MYDDASVLTEKQGGNTTSRYLLGTNRLAKYGEAPQLDGLGSMRQGVNMNNGVFTGQADYSAFGEYIGGNNIGAFQSVYQWGAESGYRMDGASSGGGDCGLVKVGARYYDPAVGRFTSRDSDLSQAPYAYCGGDPINLTDPSGHSWISSFLHSAEQTVRHVLNNALDAVNSVLSTAANAIGSIIGGVSGAILGWHWGCHRSIR